MFRLTSRPIALTPIRRKEFSTASPVFKEISRSLDQPPLSTATFFFFSQARTFLRSGMNHRLRLFYDFDLRFEINPEFFSDQLLSKRYQFQNILGRGAARILHKIGVLG